MATRNRTDDFLRIRSVQRPAPAAGEDKRPLVSAGSADESGAAKVTITPKWVTHMMDIRAIEQDITNKVNELNSLHRNHLKVQFGVRRDEEREEREINALTSDIGQLFKQCEHGISEFDAIFKDEVDDEGGTNAELAVLRNVKMCLINEVSALSRNFRDKQRQYLADLQKQKGVRDRWGNEQQQREMRDRERRDALIEKGVTPDQIETMMMHEEMVEDRNKEYQSIYESIKSLHEMFSDLHNLIVEQGTVLDRIDYNMTLTHQRLEKGRKELEKSADLLKAGRFKLLLMFLIVLIIGFGLALLFKMAG